MARLLLVFSLVFSIHFLNAQITGGRQIFTFLNLPASARITALGGLQIAVKDDDAAFALSNPAALNPSMSGKLSFDHQFQLADLQNGYFSYTNEVKRLGLTVHAGVQYVKYGKIKQTDEYGAVLGELTPTENAFVLGASRPIFEKLTVGANLKFATSSFDLYRSTALVGDLAAMYFDSSRRFTASLVLKNMGGQLSFYENTRETMPFDLQIGLSKRLKHLPFRATVVAHHLYKRDVAYNDPNLNTDTSLFGEATTTSKGPSRLDNLARHLIFSGEFLLGKTENLRLRLGYNHLRHQELTVPNLRSLAGFSFGFGIKISRFRIDYGYSIYHLAGGASHFSLSTNLHEFF